MISSNRWLLSSGARDNLVGFVVVVAFVVAPCCYCRQTLTTAHMSALFALIMAALQRAALVVIGQLSHRVSG